jgi:ADP-glucose pyrophosphorylase
VVEDGAVVRDSIILGGATIGGGAVVSESVVGPLARVAARRRVIQELVPTPRAAAPAASVPAADGGAE